MAFITDNFLLENRAAERLYHEYARDLPILDFHSHLPPGQISGNTRFRSITEVWLEGDHYKWRAMRAAGVAEHFITGPASNWEKFEKWAQIVPLTLRNPLYHWTHLELKRYFGIEDLLSGETARSIFERCNELLATEEFRVKGLLDKMKVEVICTTDDPCDDLLFHKAIAGSGPTGVYPTFRPDKAMAPESPSFKQYVLLLEQVCGKPASDFNSYLGLLKSRHEFFLTQGCRASDHGINHFYSDPFDEDRLRVTYEKALSKADLSAAETSEFKSALLYYFAKWDSEAAIVQQYHVGALRNNNTRRLEELGPDTGWDSIGDFPQAESMSKFLNRLDREGKLAKTVLYNLNPRDNEVLASMTGNFNDGTVAGKMQFGSAWWFLDQKDGMMRQMNALSSIGLISQFIGMLTDSRSFLSFPRHEYFRRLLCNLFGRDIEAGELPGDLTLSGNVIASICYSNAKSYFRF